MLSFCYDSSKTIFWLGVLRLHLKKGGKKGKKPAEMIQVSNKNLFQE